MNYIYFDIETKPDLEAVNKHNNFDPEDVKTGNLKDALKKEAKIKQAEIDFWDKAYNKAALNPKTASVLTIGYGDDEGIRIQSGDEVEVLEEFWSIAEDRTNKLIGWNIKEFDLPFLGHRSIKNGVKIPVGLFDGRYWTDRFIDLMVQVSFGKWKEFHKLSEYAKFLRVDQKRDYEVIGKDFWKHWESDHDKAQSDAYQYAVDDIIELKQIGDIIL